MTMTSEPTTSTRSDLVSDEQTMPPFKAMDGLHEEIDQLDSWISNFIGRLRPYCVEGAMTALMEQRDENDSEASPFETRIYSARVKVASIHHALDNMNLGLRL